MGSTTLISSALQPSQLCAEGKDDRIELTVPISVPLSLLFDKSHHNQIEIQDSYKTITNEVALRGIPFRIDMLSGISLLE